MLLSAVQTSSLSLFVFSEHDSLSDSRSRYVSNFTVQKTETCCHHISLLPCDCLHDISQTTRPLKNHTDEGGETSSVSSKEFTAMHFVSSRELWQESPFTTSFLLYCFVKFGSISLLTFCHQTGGFTRCQFI